MVDWSGVRKRLIERREAAGLTGKDAAAQAGVTNSYVSNLENGYSTPGAVGLIASLARIYGTSVDYLLGLTEERTPKPGPAGISPQAEIVFQMMRLLSDSGRDEVLAHVEAVVDAARRRAEAESDIQRLTELLDREVGADVRDRIVRSLVDALQKGNADSLVEIVVRAYRERNFPGDDAEGSAQ